MYVLCLRAAFVLGGWGLGVFRVGLVFAFVFVGVFVRLCVIVIAFLFSFLFAFAFPRVRYVHVYVFFVSASAPSGGRRTTGRVVERGGGADEIFYVLFPLRSEVNP